MSMPRGRKKEPRRWEYAQPKFSGVAETVADKTTARIPRKNAEICMWASRGKNGVGGGAIDEVT